MARVGSAANNPADDDPRSDVELVDAANCGDVAAFEVLYKRYRQWVTGVAFRFTRDEELSLDVLQETFMYLLRKFPDFELRAQMKTFLYPVIRHVSIALQSKARRTTTVDDPGATQPVSPAEHSREPEEQLAAAIDTLAPGQREVLMLRFADDLPLEAIATAMQIPLGTVKSRLHHALAALRADERTKKYFER